MYACMLEEDSRSHYKWLRATLLLLGIELRTSERIDSALNLSPSPELTLQPK